MNYYISNRFTFQNSTIISHHQTFY